MKVWNSDRLIFKDIHNLGYPIYHIHPYKQKVVHEICNLVNSILAYITHLIVFGSSVQSYHYNWCDLDICLVGNHSLLTNDDYTALTRIHTNIDIIRVESLDMLNTLARLHFNSVYWNIRKDGVMVYDNSNRS